MQRVPQSPLRTPVQGGTGCGAFHRSAPTGGAAKGTPSKRRTEGSVPTVPSRIPPSTLTLSAARAIGARTMTTATKRNVLRSINPPDRRAPGPTSARGLVPDRQRDDAGPRGHGDVLPPVEGVGHGRGLPGLIRLERPETLAGLRVDRDQAAAVLADEDEAGGGRQGSAPGSRRTGLRQLPRHLSRPDVGRAQDPLRLGLGRRALGSAQVGPSALPLPLVALGVDAALLDRLQVIETGRGVEGRRVPVGRAVLRGTHLRPRRRRLLTRNLHGTAVGADTGGPGQVPDERLGQEQRAVAAIEHVEEPVAVRVQHQRARLALPLRIHEHRRLGGVPVPEAVRSELVVPHALPRLAVPGEATAREEVVPLAIVSVVFLGGIAGGPIDEVERGVIAAREPGRRSAMRDVLPLPRLRPGLAGPGDGPESPDLLARGLLVGGDEAVRAVLAAGDAREDEVAGRERRR